MMLVAAALYFLATGNGKAIQAIIKYEKIK